MSRMYVEELFPDWLGQYDRMIRWYKKFEEIDQGKEVERERQDFFHDHDIVYAFFQNCFHLKDWIINDPDVTLPKSDVVDYTYKTDCLKLCSDIANGTKHLRLDKTRSGISPTIGPLNITLTELPNRNVRYAIKYSIGTTSGYFDAFEIATQSIQKWKDFIVKFVIPATKRPTSKEAYNQRGLV